MQPVAVSNIQSGSDTPNASFDYSDEEKKIVALAHAALTKVEDVSCKNLVCKAMEWEGSSYSID